MLTYLRTRLKRRPAAFLLLSLSFLILLVLSGRFSRSLVVRQQSLDEIANRLPVICTVSKGKNSLSDKAPLSALFVERLRKKTIDPMNPPPLSFIDAYVGQVYARRTVTVQPQMEDGGQPRDVTACFITHPHADPALLLAGDSAIAYDPGYDASLFDGQEAVCVAGGGLREMLNGQTLRFCIPAETMETENSSMLTLRVVGTLTTQDQTVCVPFSLYPKAFTNQPHGAYRALADSCSFVLRDNRLLSSLHQEAAPLFGGGDPGGEAAGLTGYRLSVEDTQYIERVNAAHRNLRMIQLSRPVFIGCTLVMSAFFSSLLLRPRRKEYAVLRAMGQQRRSILLQAALEAALACLLGGGMAALLNQGAEPSSLIPLSLSFLTGAVFPTLRCLRQPLMLQLKEKE